MLCWFLCIALFGIFVLFFFIQAENVILFSILFVGGEWSSDVCFPSLYTYMRRRGGGGGGGIPPPGDQEFVPPLARSLCTKENGRASCGGRGVWSRERRVGGGVTRKKRKADTAKSELNEEDTRSDMTR